ncbi:hypothetical protein BBJ28_00024648 [Nothophytophthora sp. Chile5]|nr:hypothetical protein BBJ28_00024648 [Nothophytophthora sp. Chile5]
MTRWRVPFARLDLSIDEQQQCHELTFQVLDRTLRSYDERDDEGDRHTKSPWHHAKLDSTRWKQLKTQANASLYAERTSVTHRDLNLPGDNWENPCVLLAVGTIKGDLDEVMFGIETSDFLAMQVWSETLGKQPLDGAVRAQLAGPTDVDPFQFMGVTWMVGEQAWPLNMVVRPRDFVIVSATGTMVRANGERVGYEVVQPANLPQCPPLPKPMIRGKIMYGAIYKQQEGGTVDVYIQMYVETQGRILDKLVVAAMWASTLGFWDSPRLSELKKLQWCLANSSVKRREQISAVARNDCLRDLVYCETCLEKRRQLSRHRNARLDDETACALCATPLCSNCRVKRLLEVQSERSAKLLDLHVVVCYVCLAFVQQQRPAELAKDNQKQRQDESGHDSQRLTTWSIWDQPALAPSWSPET